MLRPDPSSFLSEKYLPLWRKIIWQITGADGGMAEQTVYWQRDFSIGRGGIERGYTITRTKDGDVFYSRYKAAFKVIRKDFPKTEKQSSSKHQIFGGVKKFDGVNGSYSCDAIMNENKEEILKYQGEWEF
jgi:hypothetical protein